jgi:hypothetical protein
MYGQQFSSPAASAAKWIFFGFFGIILMGFLLGANLKDATWLNSGIATAQAEKIKMEVAHQQEMNKLQEQLTAAQTEAEIQAITREQGRLDAQYQHDIQILAQDVTNKQRMADTINNLVIYVGTTTGITIAVSALIIVITKAIAILRTTPKNPPSVIPSRSIPTMQVVKPVLERVSYDPLQSPATLFEKRLGERQEIAAQQEEIELLAARMKAILGPAQVRKEEYNKYPLAGD